MSRKYFVFRVARGAPCWIAHAAIHRSGFDLPVSADFRRGADTISAYRCAVSIPTSPTRKSLRNASDCSSRSGETDAPPSRNSPAGWADTANSSPGCAANSSREAKVGRSLSRRRSTRYVESSQIMLFPHLALAVLANDRKHDLGILIIERRDLLEAAKNITTRVRHTHLLEDSVDRRCYGNFPDLWSPSRVYNDY